MKDKLINPSIEKSSHQKTNNQSSQISKELKLTSLAFGSGISLGIESYPCNSNNQINQLVIS